MTLFGLKALLTALALVSFAAPVLARDGEVFFRKKGRVEVGPGTRLELVDCDGIHEGKDILMVVCPVPSSL